MGNCANRNLFGRPNAAREMSTFFLYAKRFALGVVCGSSDVLLTSWQVRAFHLVEEVWAKSDGVYARLLVDGPLAALGTPGLGRIRMLSSQCSASNFFDFFFFGFFFFGW